MDKRCLKHDLDITVDTWKYLFYFKLSQNIFVPWVYVKIKQCATVNVHLCVVTLSTLASFLNVSRLTGPKSDPDDAFIPL